MGGEPLPALRAVRQPDLDAFRRRSERWLLEAEAENNLILGILGSLRRGRGFGKAEPYAFTLERGAELVGCALRTPTDYPLILTRLPAEALAPLVAQIASLDSELTGVMGPEEVAEAFADAWSEHTGRPFRRGMRERIHELTEVVDPPRKAAGRIRPAAASELDLVGEWANAFVLETGLPRVDLRPPARGWIEDGVAFVWEDVADGGEARPVSMAAVGGYTQHGARIGYVYTPQELRGRGYATALTAEVSRRQLDSGRAFCCLFTDLANPTSNRIYAQIGYRPVCDVTEYLFGD